MIINNSLGGRGRAIAPVPSRYGNAYGGRVAARVVGQSRTAALGIAYVTRREGERGRGVMSFSR